MDSYALLVGLDVQYWALAEWLKNIAAVSSNDEKTLNGLMVRGFKNVFMMEFFMLWVSING